MIFAGKGFALARKGHIVSSAKIYFNFHCLLRKLTLVNHWAYLARWLASNIND